VLLKNINNARNEVDNWDDFINNLEYFREKYADIKLHSGLQIARIGTNPSLYDNVYNTSEISGRFLQDVIKIAGVEIPPIQTKHSKSVRVDIKPTAEQIAFIKDFYSDDYKYWGPYFQ
jgi:hypothetical protein